MKCRFLKVLYEAFKVLIFIPLLLAVTILQLPIYIWNSKNLINWMGEFFVNELKCEADNETH